MPLISLVLRPGAAAVLAVMLLGCATSSQVMIGTARPPISPESVRVYVQPPEKYEEIAAIDATSQGSFADQQSGSIGTGVGSSSYGPGSATGVGVGGSFGIYNKATHGIAIFVPQ